MNAHVALHAGGCTSIHPFIIISSSTRPAMSYNSIRMQQMRMKRMIRAVSETDSNNIAWLWDKLGVVSSALDDFEGTRRQKVALRRMDAELYSAFVDKFIYVDM